MASTPMNFKGTVKTGPNPNKSKNSPAIKGKKGKPGAMPPFMKKGQKAK
jgi:hypothetical protein